MAVNKQAMQYDSSPPVYYDDPSLRYDEPLPAPTNQRKHMVYAVLKLKDKTLDQKLDFTTALAGNLTTYATDYPSPAVTPAQFTGKESAIVAKKQEVTSGQSALDAKLTELDDLEADLDASLIIECAYVQQKSGGVEAKIRELGMDIQASPTAPTTPGQVQNFRLMAGNNPGEVKTACKPDDNATGYEYQITSDPTKVEDWTLLDASSGCRHTLTGLTSGAKMYLRCRAMGKRNTGKGPWSDIATITVP